MMSNILLDFLKYHMILSFVLCANVSLFYVCYQLRFGRLCSSFISPSDTTVYIDILFL